MVKTGFSLLTSSFTNSESGCNSSATSANGSGPAGDGPLAVMKYGSAGEVPGGRLMNLSTAGVRSAGCVLVADPDAALVVTLPTL